MSDHNYAEQALRLHKEWRGKLEVVPRADVSTKEALAIAYTPGVAAPCLEIEKDVDLSYDYTRRWNLCLVVTDGSAVLGLGNIGPEAAMPVMEGKCVLFKAFGGVDAFPLCIRSNDVDEIVRTIELVSGSFGGVNLEDIAAPQCFEIERKLMERCDIPIFHDDQHGTAVVVLAGLLNALKVTGKEMSDVSIVFSGAGAASIAVARILLAVGAKNIVLCDRHGAIYSGRDVGMNAEKALIAEVTNERQCRGSLADALVGADVFIGLSGPGLLTGDMVRSMAEDPIVFACANPIPEILPAEAIEAGAAIVATGRSDFPNQINNVLAFPGIFRGTFDVRAREINEEMKVAAAMAIADMVDDASLSSEYLLPDATDKNLCAAVAAAVSEAAVRSGVARI
ncbi:MAG: NAD(P)-dependent malic enzyme [Saccharofermentanales bacterium]|jgi:malate dehydrogenase (oxaloacetate-decarboxylating)